MSDQRKRCVLTPHAQDPAAGSLSRALAHYEYGMGLEELADPPHHQPGIEFVLQVTVMPHRPLPKNTS